MPFRLFIDKPSTVTIANAGAEHLKWITRQLPNADFNYSVHGYDDYTDFNFSSSEDATIFRLFWQN